jgi:3-hydroxyisobutyrate dehydrogenase
MASIGFVGLGHMGLPMAINLLKAGHTVSGYDLQKSTFEPFGEAGGIVTATLHELAYGKDILITMLQTGQQVWDVCCANQGLYSNAAPHTLHIDCSTIDVETSRRLHQQASEKQIIMIDAPVSGGVAGAVAATLTFMVGGEEAAFRRAKPILSDMGKKIYHTGEVGNGQAAKICNNMILGMSMIGVSEAFLLAEKLGLSAHKLLDVVNNASGRCWVTTHYPPVPNLLPDVPANHDYQPGFAAAMMLKDLLLSQQSAKDAGLTTPLAAKATSIYQQFIESGHGDLDFSAIIKQIPHSGES